MDRREFLYLAGGSAVWASVELRAEAALDETRHAAKAMTLADFKKERKFLEVSQGRIAYIERGRGSAALFLHGFPLSGFQWRGVIPRLAAQRRCLAPDFLALGATEVREGQSVTPADQARMIVEFLNKLSITSVDVVASDSGGAVAQLLAARHPKLIRTLLLTNCDTEPDSPPPAVVPVIELARAGKYVDQWLVPWVADKNLARSEKGLGGMCYANKANPTDEAIEMYLAPLVSSPRRKTLANAYAVGLAPNPLAGVEAALKRCDFPVRIVWGTSDSIFSSASPDYLDRIFRNSRGVRRVAGAKLFFPEEQPELIAEEASQLWKAPEAGSAKSNG